MSRFVEVRDWPRTGYLVPGRDGPGLWPDGRVVGTSRRRRRRLLGIQVDIQARKLYLEFFTWFWCHGERYLRMETRVLHRISIQILWALWFGLRSHFQKSACFDFHSKVTILIFQEHVPKTIQGSATQPLEPPARTAVKKGFQYYECIWIVRSTISRIGLSMDRTIQYFQDMRKLKNSDFQYFQDMRKLKKSDFQYL